MGGFEFAECHLKASHVVVARQLMIILNNEGAESVRLYSPSKITFDDLKGPILANGINIDLIEKDQYNWLLLICPTDSVGWCVVYRHPAFYYDTCEFPRAIKELGCDALFYGYTERTFGWAWESYQKGRLIDRCTYHHDNQWYRMDENSPLPGEPPNELSFRQIYLVYGRTFTEKILTLVLYHICKLPLVERAQYKLIVATHRRRQ
jgi:hypothetical protein